MNQKILETICECVRTHSDYDGDINPNTKLHGDGIDSLDVVEIVMECEQKLHVGIPNDIVYNPEMTIGRLAEWIEEKLS